jgi:hypothetical protein
MEITIDSAIGMIEVILITGAIGFDGVIGLRDFPNDVRRGAMDDLKKPTLSLLHFSRQMMGSYQ